MKQLKLLFDERKPFKRSWRWTFEIDGLPPMFVRASKRPSLVIDEIDVYENGEVRKIVGKQTWEPIDLTFYDAVDIQKVFSWVSEIFNLKNETSASRPKTASLKLIDWTGTILETWQLEESCPQSVGLTPDELQMTLRYNKAVRLECDK